jgi:hypothetical protein
MAARRGLLPAALALLWLVAAAAPGNPGGIRATNSWNPSLAPMALQQGVPTDVKITVHDGSEMIGCVVVDLPAGFTVVSASISSVPTGSVWTAVVAGSGPTSVTFSSTTAAGRLNGGAAGVFDILVVATARPLPAWSVSAYKSLTVDSTPLDGNPQSAPGPFNIIAPATPAPTATTTQGPVASAGPSLGTTPGPVPNSPPGVGPSVSPSPGAIAAAETTAAGSGGIGTGGGDVTPLDVRALPAGGSVQLDSQAVGGIGMFAWMVPGLFLTLPALLLLLVFVVQGGLAMIFVPVTRRVLGVGRRRHPRGRPVLR